MVRASSSEAVGCSLDSQPRHTKGDTNGTVSSYADTATMGGARKIQYALRIIVMSQ